jgi:hypothetical protein
LTGAAGVSPRPEVARALLGIALVSLCSFAAVEPTNFSGFDEWLDIDLASRGILAMPYQNRPLSLLFFVPGAFPPRLGLTGHWVVHWLYLTVSGLLSFLLVRRIGAHTPLAFLAGVVAAVWASTDPLRLDVVLGRGYSGATAATLFVLLLYAESCRARRRDALLLACGLVVVLGLAAEAVLPLLALGLVLPWIVPGDAAARRTWSAALAGSLVLCGVWVAWALRPGAAPSYQSAALGFDPHPYRVAARVLGLAREHLRPLAGTDPGDLAAPWSLASVTVFLLAWLLVHRAARGEVAPARRAVLGLLLAGAVTSTAGYAAFASSTSIPGPERTQFLSSPGIGLLLAALVWLAAAAAPERLRSWLVAACGAWLVAVSAGRTTGLQREWRDTTYWPAQNASLVALTDLVPMTRANTLIVLIDERGAWPANFSFRHAVRHLYAGNAVGFVPGAHEAFLYPGSFAADGFHYLPWPVIRGPWNAPVTLHGYDQMIVLRLPRSGPLVLLEEWPAGALPRLPAGARFEPRGRIVTDAQLPASRAILRRP